MIIFIRFIHIFFLPHSVGVFSLMCIRNAHLKLDTIHSKEKKIKNTL